MKNTNRNKIELKFNFFGFHVALSVLKLKNQFIVLTQTDFALNLGSCITTRQAKLRIRHDI